MPQTNYDMEQYELGNVERIEDWPTNYPIMELLVHRSIPYFYAVDTFVANFPISSKNFGYVEEVDRVQQLLDEFGKTDPEITPTVIVDLFNAGFVYEITKRLIHWAILSNLEADGDTRNTLLPPRVVALYREIDSQGKFPVQLALCPLPKSSSRNQGTPNFIAKMVSNDFWTVKRGLLSVCEV